MSASRLRTLGEVVSVLALVGSLVFVGVETHQNAEATRAATQQRVADNWEAWNLTMADPRVWGPAARMDSLHDYSRAGYEDQAAVVSLIRSLFSTWSNAYYQYGLGYLDGQTWQGMLLNMRMNLDGTYGEGWTRLVRWAWSNNRPIYAARFQALFDSIEAAASSGRAPGAPRPGDGGSP